MNLSTYILFTIVIIALGVLATFIINKYSISLFLIKREHNKVLKKEYALFKDFKEIEHYFLDINKKLNTEIENLCTLESIKEIGILDTDIKVLSLIQEKNENTKLFIENFRETANSIDRLNKYNYPTTDDILIGLLSISKSIILKGKGSYEDKAMLFNDIIKRSELTMFYVMYAFDNFNEENLEIIEINKLTQKELLTFNTVKSIYNDDYIKISKKLDAYEEIALKNGLNKSCDI